MRFAYCAYDAGDRPDDKSGVILRPALKVLVIGASGTREVPIWGRIDAGSDDCILPFSIADEIKPIWHAGRWLVTDFQGKPSETQYGSVYLRIRLKDSLVRWPAIVAFDRKRDEALWGLTGFLEHFRLTLDGPQKHFTVRLPAPTPPGFSVEHPPKRRRVEKRWGGRFSDDAPITPDEQDP